MQKALLNISLTRLKTTKGTATHCLRDPAHASDLCAPQFDTFEAIEIGDSGVLRLFDLVRVHQNCSYDEYQDRRGCLTTHEPVVDQSVVGVLPHHLQGESMSVVPFPPGLF